MRSKSRFTTLALLETRKSYLEIGARLLCTLRCHCRQGVMLATKQALPLSGTVFHWPNRTKLALRTRSPQSILLSPRPARAQPAVRRRDPHLLCLRPCPLRLHQDLGAASCCPRLRRDSSRSPWQKILRRCVGSCCCSSGGL